MYTRFIFKNVFLSNYEFDCVLPDFFICRHINTLLPVIKQLSGERSCMLTCCIKQNNYNDLCMQIHIAVCDLISGSRTLCHH